MQESVIPSELLAAWTFRRRDDRLTIQREVTDQGIQLLVSKNGQPRAFGFSSLDRLVAFQCDMEAFLVQTGWSLAEFTPDRRRGADRRGFPRIALDRRRWWTDGHEST
jgi:hypothetical protein